MSATLDRDALRTVDHSEPIDDARVHTLEEADRELESVQQLLTAGKPLEQCSVSLTVGHEQKYDKELATARLTMDCDDEQELLWSLMGLRKKKAFSTITSDDAGAATAMRWSLT